MQMLKEEVTNNQFDIALGIDGDADRVGVVDNKAVFTPIDNVLIILCPFPKLIGVYKIPCLTTK